MEETFDKYPRWKGSCPIQTERKVAFRQKVKKAIEYYANTKRNGHGLHSQRQPNFEVIERYST